MRFGGLFRKGRKGVVIILTMALLVIGGGGHHEVTAVEDSYERLKVFAEVLSLVQANYVEETKPRDLIYSGIKGMLESLDLTAPSCRPISSKRCRSRLRACSEGWESRSRSRIGC